MVKDVTSRYDGRLEIDELRTIKDSKGIDIVVGRMAELRIVEPRTEMVATTANIPYGSRIFFKDGDMVKDGDMICEWDPSTTSSFPKRQVRCASRTSRKALPTVWNRTRPPASEKITIESKDRTIVPKAHLVDRDGNILRSYSLPVGAHLLVNEGESVTPGQAFVKIPRATGNVGDITGGLPRVTELFEARNPSNPAVVSEIDGEVEFGKIERGNQGDKRNVEARRGEEVPCASVEADSRAGERLCAS